MGNPYPNAPDATPELIEAYEQQPVVIERHFAGVVKDKLTTRPVAGKWSMIEWIAHIADSDLVLADRIKRCIAEKCALMMAYDESLFAERLYYQEREAGEEIELLRASRRQIARILRHLTPEQWAREAVHSERGLQSTKRLVQMSVGHINHHLPFLEEKLRAMGMQR